MILLRRLDRPVSVMVTGVDILRPAEMRVLGALLEKEITTPEYYPLTVNALANACNQKSSREPVVNYDEDTVIDALETLKDRGLVVRVSGAGHRVEKWGHRLGERMNFGRRDLALLCVLLLRGPQTVGELRGRTERMHEFTDLEEVERCLEALSERTPDPLTTRMPRGRWMHLLGGAPVDAPEEQFQPLEDSGGRAGLAERVAVLESEIERLKLQFESFRRQFE